MVNMNPGLCTDVSCTHGVQRMQPQDISYMYCFVSTAIQVDMRKNYERRQHLASMLLPDDPEKGRSVLMVDFVVAVCFFSPKLS